jgi:hypothetical protein
VEADSLINLYVLTEPHEARRILKEFKPRSVYIVPPDLVEYLPDCSQYSMAKLNTLTLIAASSATIDLFVLLLTTREEQT